MSPKGQVYLFALLFSLTGLAFAIYKVTALNFPLLPSAERKVWSIEAKITFDARGEPISANLALPDIQQQYSILDEVFASAGYGFNIQEDRVRRAEWTRRDVSGPQTLYYKLEIAAREDALPPGDSAPPDEISSPVWTSAEAAAAAGLIRTATELSADDESLALQLLKLMSADQLSQDAQLLFESRPDQSTAQLAIRLFQQAEIPARMVRGIYLSNRLYNQKAEELVEVYADGEWTMFDPGTASRGIPENFFMWQRGGRSLLDVVGGYNSRVRFSVLSNVISAKAVALQEASEDATGLVDLNIYALPIEKQAIFKSLLLVPIGALVVVLFRIIVGLRTSGTFMPVLIALAFIQTELLPGLTTLLTLLIVGLWIRSYLSKLDLLMVARLAAVVIVVVILMAGLSIFSYKLGLDEFLSITFFPMIIIAWTIERMSIVWEEDGGREVLIQGGGSLVVAIIAYLVMTNNVIEHLTYNFPEILLVELGLILMLGQYTGYRLSELKRFRFMIDKP